MCCSSPRGSTFLKWFRCQKLSHHISLILSIRTKPVIQALRSLLVCTLRQREAQVQQRETIPSHSEGNRPVSPLNPWRTNQWNHMQLSQHTPHLSGVNQVGKILKIRHLSRCRHSWWIMIVFSCVVDLDASHWTFIIFQWVTQPVLNKKWSWGEGCCFFVSGLNNQKCVLPVVLSVCSLPGRFFGH